MTGSGLLTSALALVGDNNPADYESLGISCINIILAETYEINNRLRVAAGLAVLTSIPEVTALSETLTYEPMLVRRALPYGLAVQLILDERDASLWNVLHAKYIDALRNIDVGFVELVSYGERIDDAGVSSVAPPFGFEFFSKQA